MLAFLGTGCSFSNSLHPNPPADIEPVLPSATIQNTPQPDPTPTLPAPFPEPQGEAWKSFSFDYLCSDYSVPLLLYQSSYDYFFSSDKYFYFRDSLPDDWLEQFYLNFLSSSHDLDVINSLIDEVSGAINQEGDELVIALTGLIQNLTYDCDKLFSYDHLDGEGYQTNFPYETLYNQKGVCGDTSILLAKILHELGYGAAFLIYEENNHMALGIQCPLEAATYTEGQMGYCYIETTGPTRIGVKPSSLGGEDFVESPYIIPISSGRSFEAMTLLQEEMEQEALDYGDVILQLATCQEVSLYKEIQDRSATLTAHEGHLANLNIKLDKAKKIYLEEVEHFQSLNCEGVLPPEQYDLCLDQQQVLEDATAVYQKRVNDYNQVVALMNAEVGRFNLAVDNFNSLMDAKDQSCAVVFSERIDLLEEGEGEETEEE